MQRLFISSMMLLFVFAGAVAAQQPCSAAESKQFDFWLGEWELEWAGADGKPQKGTNKITKVLGGCVVQERFDGGEAMPLRGISHSVYDARAGKWKQTWVDNSGGYLDFTGGMADDKMTLSRSFTNAAGATVMQRMVFYNIKPDSLDWNWENSTDSGKTWNLIWKIAYKKKKG